MPLTYHTGPRGLIGSLVGILNSAGTQTNYGVIPAMTLDDGTGTGSPLGSAANPLNITSGSGASSNQVQGNAASGATDTGNPVKIGGLYATPATGALGQRQNALTDQYGNLRASLVGSQLIVGSDASSNNLTFVGDPASQSANLKLAIAGFVFNGTNWDRQRGDVVSTFSRTPPTTKAASAVTAGSTTSQQLFAASATRSKVLIQNQDAAINIFVNVGAAAVAGAGNLRIAPGSTLELTGTSEAINLIAASGTPAICAWQF